MHVGFKCGKFSGETGQIDAKKEINPENQYGAIGYIKLIRSLFHCLEQMQLQRGETKNAAEVRAPGEFTGSDSHRDEGRRTRCTGSGNRRIIHDR